MVIFVPESSNAIKYCLGYQKLEIDCHPDRIETEVRKVVENLDVNSYYYCYNTLILDYIDPELLILVKDDGSNVKFTEVFDKELPYLYPGEILLRLVNKK